MVLNQQTIFSIDRKAELFLYIDLTKKKSSKKKYQSLNIIFSNLPW
jgi:hypothetical protein